MLGNCRYCNTEITLNYCPNCGQPTKLKRIDSQYILHELEHELHFEKGILFSIKELFLRPGKSIRLFIREDRSRLVKPVFFIIISSLIYTIISHQFHIEEEYMKFAGDNKSAIFDVFQWIQSHYGYGNILLGIFIAFWTKVFFKKYNYNFFEILILLCFVIGAAMLIYGIFALIQGLTQVKLMDIAGIAGFAYTTWAIGQFFDGKPITYLKSFLAYMIGMFTFGIAAVILGLIIDLISPK